MDFTVLDLFPRMNLGYFGRHFRKMLAEQVSDWLRVSASEPLSPREKSLRFSSATTAGNVTTLPANINQSVSFSEVEKRRHLSCSELTSVTQVVGFFSPASRNGGADESRMLLDVQNQARQM
jgi:hypothetical protein